MVWLLRFDFVGIAKFVNVRLGLEGGEPVIAQKGERMFQCFNRSLGIISPCFSASQKLAVHGYGPIECGNGNQNN